MVLSFSDLYAQAQQSALSGLSQQMPGSLGGIGSASMIQQNRQEMSRREYYSWEQNKGRVLTPSRTAKSYREELQSEIDEWLK